MSKKRVAVLYGGRSSEHEVSVQSGKTVIHALSKMADKYDVVPVYITKDGHWLLHGETAAVLSPDASHRGLISDSGEILPIDVVFPALHGKNGEDGSVQGVCALAGVPCVGAGILSSALCMDKDYARRIAASVKGLEHTPYLTVSADELIEFDNVAERVELHLGYPCFCKPANAGSSLGTSKAADKDELYDALRLASAHDFKILIERAVSGRELEVGILGNHKPIISVVGEIIVNPAHSGFYDYEAKYYSDAARIIVPADISKNTEYKIRKQALAVYRAMGCSGLSRVDFFLERNTDRIIFNEINTIPGFTSTSMYPKLFLAAGFSLSSLFDKLVELAVEA